MNSHTRMLLFLLFLAAGGLPGCSGPAKKAGETCASNRDCEQGLICISGSCSNAVVKPELKTPVAQIVAATRVRVESRVRIDGSRSIGYSGNGLDYAWELTAPEGSQSKLSDTKVSQVNFTPDIAGKYALKLIVTDQAKASEAATLEIEAFKDNTPPEASVTPATAQGKIGDTVSLDGSGSKDADGDTLTYKWTIKNKPKDSTATLSGDSTDKTSITADKAGLYIVHLEVSDGNGGSAQAQSLITIAQDPVKPKITALDPAKGAKGSMAQVSVTGENFAYGLKVMFDGKEVQKVTYVNETKLLVELDLTSTNAGKYPFKVANPGETPTESDPVDFEVVEAPKPTISNVGPSLVVTGQNVRLVIDGTGFLPGAKVSFDGNNLNTNYTSDKVLRATLLVPKDGSYEVIVTNPDGKASDPYTFDVSSVNPLIDKLSFRLIGNDCTKETLTITGRNLLPGLSVELVLRSDPTKKYTPIKTTLVSISELQLEFDFTKIPKGEYDIIIKNAGSDATAKSPFEVTDTPVKPGLITAVPLRFYAEGKRTLYFAGYGLDGARFTLDSKPLTLTSINRSTYKAEVDLTGVNPGKLKLEVTGVCNVKLPPMELEVIDIPTPTIEAITPSEVNLGQTDDIEVTGEGFHPTARLLLDGMALTDATYKHGGLFTFPAKHLTKTATVKIVVENPGGKKSAEKELKVDFAPRITDTDPDELGPGATSNVKIDGINFDPAATLTVNGQPATGVTVKSSKLIEVEPKNFPTHGTYKLVVTNPNGEKSAEYEFKANFEPTIEDTVPSMYVVGDTLGSTTSPTTEVEIEGANFDPAAKVYVNGTLLTTGVTVNSSSSIDIPLSTFSSAGNYKIVVENPNGVKSNEWTFPVLNSTGDPLEIGIVFTYNARNFYVCGRGIGDATTNIIIKKAGQEIFNDDLPTSSIFDEYCVWKTLATLPSFTKAPHEITACRTISGTQSCSKPFTWTPTRATSGGSTTTPPSSGQPFQPIIAYIKPDTPTSFVLPTTNPPTTIDFSIIGNYFASDSKIFINGKDLTTITGATFSVTTGTISVKSFPVSELVMGDNPIEVQATKGRSNTSYLNLANAARIRLSWVRSQLIPNFVSFRFEVAGAGFDRSEKIYANGAVLTTGTTSPSPLSWSSSSSRLPYYLYGNSWSSTYTKALASGDTAIYLENIGNVKSNTVSMRVVEPGQWGDEPFAIHSIGSTTSRSSLAPGLAPHDGDEVKLRIGFTRLVAKVALGDPGKVVVDGTEYKDYTIGTLDYGEGFEHIKVDKIPITGAPRVVPIYLKNPDGKVSNSSFLTVMPKGVPRISRIGGRRATTTSFSDEYEYHFAAIIRPGRTQELRVNGSDLKGAKFWLAGIPLEARYHYKSSSSTSPYEYVYLNFELSPDVPDGVYPLWATNNGFTTNTVLVKVARYGIGSAPRVTSFVPAIVNQAALAKTNNKVRFMIFGNAGLTPDAEINFNGKKHKIIYAAGNISFVELDMTGLAKGKHKFSVEVNGMKSHEFQVELD